MKSGWDWKEKKALFYFIVKSGKLSDKIKIIGPPVELKEHVKSFKKKYKKTVIKNKVVYAEIQSWYYSLHGRIVVVCRRLWPW